MTLQSEIEFAFTKQRARISRDGAGLHLPLYILLHMRFSRVLFIQAVLMHSDTFHSQSVSAGIYRFLWFSIQSTLLRIWAVGLVWTVWCKGLCFYFSENSSGIFSENETLWSITVGLQRKGYLMQTPVFVAFYVAVARKEKKLAVSYCTRWHDCVILRNIEL